MSAVQTLILGFIAGVTILLGLPLGRLRSPRHSRTRVAGRHLLSGPGHRRPLRLHRCGRDRRRTTFGRGHRVKRPAAPRGRRLRRSQLQIRWGRFDSAVGSLQRAESSIAELSDPRAEAVRVQLQLRQAVVRARQGDRNTADELVTEARARIRARQIPAHRYPNIIASGLNADMHWMAVAMEAQDGTTALTRSREVNTNPLPSGPTDRNRNASWWADLARAYLLHGDRARCLDAVRRARAESPQWVRYHPGVHETLHTVAAQDTRATDGLAELIAWIQGPDKLFVGCTRRVGLDARAQAGAVPGLDMPDHPVSELVGVGAVGVGPELDALPVRGGRAQTEPLAGTARCDVRAGH